MIIIVGDSWGVGEWGIDPVTRQFPCIIGPGIGQLLMLHDQVVNLAVGGGSNADSLDRLENFLTNYKINANDTVYWIITCPTRGLDFNTLIANTNGIMANVHVTLNQFFTRANQLAIINNVCIKLIGGLCDLTDVSLAKYSNLEMCVPSWGRLLDKDYNQSLLWHVHDLGHFLRGKPNFISEWTSIANQVLDKTETIERLSPKYFNAIHPNRLAHRVLRDHLYPQWHFKF